MSAKSNFTKDYNAVSGQPSLMILVIRLPWGAMEVIQNTEEIEQKFMYCLETYDEDMKMYKNSDIRVLGWIIL